MSLRLSSILITIALVGCASTPEGLKSDPARRRDFIAETGYQLTFKRIVDGHRECASQPLLPLGNVIADAQLFPDLKLGTFVLGASGVGTQINQVIEVRGLADGKTAVTVYTAGDQDRVTRRYQRWAAGDASCNF